MDWDLPEDLFEFVSENRDDITSFTAALGKFLQEQQSHPCIVLTSLTNVIDYIIEEYFDKAENTDHLRRLLNQTMEAYQNTILGAGDEIIRRRFTKNSNRPVRPVT